MGRVAPQTKHVLTLLMHIPRCIFASFTSALVLLAACGDDSATSINKPGAVAPVDQTTAKVGTATAVGAIAGKTLTPKSAASATLSQDGNLVVVVLSNQADYCAATTAGLTRPNHRSLVAIVTTVDAAGDNPKVAPGTFTVHSEAPDGPGSFANAAFNASDAGCSDTLGSDVGNATAGTVVLTQVTSSQIVGSYDLSFGSDTLKGTFTAPACPGLIAQIESGDALTCSAK